MSEDLNITERQADSNGNLYREHSQDEQNTNHTQKTKNEHTCKSISNADTDEQLALNPDGYEGYENEKIYIIQNYVE